MALPAGAQDRESGSLPTGQPLWPSHVGSVQRRILGPGWSTPPNVIVSVTISVWRCLQYGQGLWGSGQMSRSSVMPTMLPQRPEISRRA